MCVDVQSMFRSALLGEGWSVGFAEFTEGSKSHDFYGGTQASDREPSAMLTLCSTSEKYYEASLFLSLRNVLQHHTA